MVIVSKVVLCFVQNSIDGSETSELVVAILVVGFKPPKAASCSIITVAENGEIIPKLTKEVSLVP